MIVTIPVTPISWENVKNIMYTFLYFVNILIDFSTFLGESNIDSNKKYI